MSIVLRKDLSIITDGSISKLESNLLMTIEALPGLHICSYSFTNNIFISIHVEECTQEGLFFLCRCLSNRYWQYGHYWSIQLEVRDEIYPNGDRPISYQIFRPITIGFKKKDLEKEIKSLIENMNHHFNHENFMKLYDMNREGYYLVDEVQYDRNDRLNKLLT